MQEVDEEIKEAQKVLEEINQDEHERYLAELREKYIYDMNTLKSEGFEDGLKQGIEQGTRHEKLEIAKNMKIEGEEMEKIKRYTGLTKEEIEKL